MVPPPPAQYPVGSVVGAGRIAEIDEYAFKLTDPPAHIADTFALTLSTTGNPFTTIVSKAVELHPLSGSFPVSDRIYVPVAVGVNE